MSQQVSHQPRAGSSSVRSTHDPGPDFGEGVAHLPGACSPRDLYCSLLDLDENVHYHEPAFWFATAALGRPAVSAWASGTAAEPGPDLVQQLLQRANADLGVLRVNGYGASWPVRVAKEFAPLGLSDGVWLRGAVQFQMVESQQGMAAVAQLMIRFAGPGVGEPYAQRYAALLSSLGIVPASIGRWEPEGEAPAVDISYEHALLAPCLSLFPGAFAAETAGFNLWMAAVGPCPLLAALCRDLRGRANVAYFDGYDRDRLSGLARDGVRAILAEEADSVETRERIARGFAAAHRSYTRWEQAMRGANVPMTARDSMLEIIGPKARFAIGHHLGVLLDGNGAAVDVETCFAGGRAGHGRLLDALAASPLIRPGAPDQSPFMTNVITFGGPMFDVFTPPEQACLREWIASLPDEHRASAPEPVALEGSYRPPQDPTGLRNHAIEKYAVLPPEDLLYRLLNADRYPPVRVFGRIFASQALDALAGALEDPRLDSAVPPPYSERQVAEMVAANHARNVRMRTAEQRACAGKAKEASDAPGSDPQSARDGHASLFHVSATAEGVHAPLAGAPLDGCWLGGFADVHRIALEEYGWLFRIYTGELGDGHLEWNHNYILRRMHIENGMAPADALLSLRDRRLYDVVQVTVAEIAMIAMSLNTRFFLPEMLGMNLFIEAKGVGGYYLATEEAAERAGKKWTALSMRLHNAIDNYATGHTQWSVAAIQAFMARVQDAGPRVRAEQWHRIWRLWRFNELRDYGTKDQQRVLEELLGSVATDSFVPSEL
jgi:hypothetical protein